MSPLWTDRRVRGDELAFVPADPDALQSKARPNIFVIGDAFRALGKLNPVSQKWVQVGGDQDGHHSAAIR